MRTFYSFEKSYWLQRHFLVSKSLPVLAMVTQPGSIGWCYDSVILTLALPRHTHTHTQKALVLLGQDLKNMKLLVSLLLMLDIYLKPGKQNTCSLGNTGASLAKHDDDVERFVCIAAYCGALLAPCLLLGIVGWILLKSLPSVLANVEISGGQVRPSWSSVYTGQHTCMLCEYICL